MNRRPLLRCAATALAVALSVCLATPASAAWREASSAHFVIYSEQSAKALQEFATRLETFDEALRFLRKLPDEPVGDANRVTVYVLGEGLVQKIYGDGARRGDSEIRGFYIPRAGGSAAFVPRPSGNEGTYDLTGERVLLHEYTHHFMLQNFPNAYPAWFIEGFAEYNAAAKFEKDGGIGIGLVPGHRIHDLLQNRMPVEKLISVNRARLGSDEGSAIYSRGWLLVHYLTNETARQGQLSDYLKRMARGEGSLEAARAAFGDLKELDRDLERYLSKRFYYTAIAAGKLAPVSVRIRELRPGENATMAVRIRSHRGVDKEEAEALVPIARAAAAPYPNDAAAQDVLAEAEYDARHYAEAEAAADRAIAADPKSVHAWLYKARSEMALAHAAGDRGAARWQAIRKLITSANRLDTTDPRPPILYFGSYVAQGVKPTANAAEGLTAALGLAPQDVDLRMMVAHRQLVDGKGKEARVTLAPIAFNPHGGAAAEAASRAITLLDSGGPQAALAAWTKPPEEEDEAGAGKKQP